VIQDITDNIKRTISIIICSHYFHKLYSGHRDGHKTIAKPKHVKAKK